MYFFKTNLSFALSIFYHFVVTFYETIAMMEIYISFDQMLHSLIKASITRQQITKQCLFQYQYNCAADQYLWFFTNLSKYPNISNSLNTSRGRRLNKVVGIKQKSHQIFTAYVDIFVKILPDYTSWMLRLKISNSKTLDEN